MARVETVLSLRLKRWAFLFDVGVAFLGGPPRAVLCYSFWCSLNPQEGIPFKKTPRLSQHHKSSSYRYSGQGLVSQQEPDLFAKPARKGGLV